MSGGKKVNDDEFDPIPVLIPKHSNQGKAERCVTRAPADARETWALV